MNELEHSINILRKRGFRITKNRKLLLNILSTHKKPLNALQIGQEMKKRGGGVNKTTIYRELDTLHSEKIITAHDFGERANYYEFALRQHHHHLVCKSCKKITDIQIANDLSKEEERIKNLHSFLVDAHALEFFGTCKNCT